MTLLFKLYKMYNNVDKDWEVIGITDLGQGPQVVKRKKNYKTEIWQERPLVESKHY